MSSKNSLLLSTVVEQCDNIFAQEIDNDIVMLDPERGFYFGANRVGNTIWELIQAPQKIEDICAELLNRFTNVDQVTCEKETLTFLNQLYANNLIKVVE